MMAVSCDKNDGIGTPDDFQSINGSDIVVNIASTKASSENMLVDVETNGFYLYVDQDGDTTTTAGDGDKLVFMKCEGATWSAYDAENKTTAVTDFKWVDFKRATVTALYAMEDDTNVAEVSASDIVNLTASVPVDQSSAIKCADWLVASSLRDGLVVKSDETGALTLAFDHLYSRMTIKVMKDATEQSSVKSVAISNAKCSAVMDLSSSLVSFDFSADSAVAVTFYLNTSTPEAVVYEAILLPQSFTEGIDIAINTYDEIFVYSTLVDLDATVDGDQVAIVGGQAYEIAVPVPSGFFQTLD